MLIISAKGSNIDLLHVLFGSVLALNNDALILLTAIASITLFTLAVLYRPLVIECVDPTFFRSISKLSSVAHFGFLLLVVLNLVAGFHALGTLMAVGLMILPVAVARFWTDKLGTMFVIAFLTSVISCYLGLFLSFHASFATSPAIILVMGLIYILSILFGRRGALRSHR
ncbi:metal ABC transporter permease [Psychromonas sp. KJ10-10]|uniref:metal ABC transporter permease n=1 Tax=Psychromonas sp. KJ10-10 TaxID=3391823 RepID=UPI0039B6D06C